MDLWYPTSSARRLTHPGGGTWVLAGTVHARQLGTTVTACGLEAVDWPMLFYRQFQFERGQLCDECLDVASPVRAGQPVH